jgi:hypothetical protein
MTIESEETVWAMPGRLHILQESNQPRDSLMVAYWGQISTIIQLHRRCNKFGLFVLGSINRQSSKVLDLTLFTKVSATKLFSSSIPISFHAYVNDIVPSTISPLLQMLKEYSPTESQKLETNMQMMPFVLSYTSLIDLISSLIAFKMKIDSDTDLIESPASMFASE